MYTISHQVFYITRGTQPSNGRVPILKKTLLCRLFPGMLRNRSVPRGGALGPWHLLSCTSPAPRTDRTPPRDGCHSHPGPQAVSTELPANSPVCDVTEAQCNGRRTGGGGVSQHWIHAPLPLDIEGSVPHTQLWLNQIISGQSDSLLIFYWLENLFRR